MRTVSQAVEEIINRSPFLLEAISEGVANNAEIARKIRCDVEERLMEKVSLAAITMALHRLEKQVREPEFGMKLLKQMNDVTVRSNLVAFILPNATTMSEILGALSKSAHRRRDAFLHFSRGLHESLIIVSREMEDEVTDIVRKEKGIRKKNNLSAIMMRLPESSLTVPGVYYPILKAIALAGISLVEVMSVATEFGILFEDKDVDHAFSVIKRITS